MKKLNFSIVESYFNGANLTEIRIEGVESVGKILASNAFRRPDASWEGVVKYGYHFSRRENRNSILENGFIPGEDEDMVYFYTGLGSLRNTYVQDLNNGNPISEGWDVWVVDLEGCELNVDTRISWTILVKDGLIPVAIRTASKPNILGYIEYPL
jgi:hypothetical protein